MMRFSFFVDSFFVRRLRCFCNCRTTKCPNEKPKTNKRINGFIALIVFVFFIPLVHAFTVPPNDGFVTDAAGVLTPEQKQTLEQDLTAYRAQTSNQIAVALIESLQGEAIADVALQIGRKWGVGLKDKNNGILILIARTDREVFIATGYGLEGAVPDIVAKGIIDTDMTGAFRDGNYYDGIVAGIDALKKHIGGEYTADRYTQKSSGGFFGPALFVIFIVMQIFGSLMAKTRSWWLGGVLGGVAGIILTTLYSWWLSIPVLVALGLLIDFVLSRSGLGRRRSRGGFYGGGGFGSSGGGTGGFGGFGGGSFGGGGASGKWRQALALAIMFSLALAGCRKTSVLPPDEVLHRAALASQNLQSATVAAEGDVSFAGALYAGNVHGTIGGVLQNSGAQSKFSFDVGGTLQESGTSYAITVTADVIVMGEQEVYLNLRSLSVDPPHPSLNAEAVRQFVGTWWKLPSKAPAAPASPVTPDPQYLRVQSQVVHVTRDRGMTTAGGREVYDYEVALDSAKLIAYLRQMAEQKHAPFDDRSISAFVQSHAVTGGLQIDAETFAVDHIAWKVAPIDPRDQSFAADVRLDLTEPNAAPPVIPPPDARPFVPGQFFSAP